MLHALSRCHSDPALAREESRINFTSMFPNGNKPERFRFAGHDSVTYETTFRQRIFSDEMHILDFGFPILHYA